MAPLKRWSRLDWLIILLFAGLVGLFYWRILTPNLADRQSFPPGDFSAQFWAFTTFEARELSAGRLPLWNPYTYAGAPFWADVQSAVFYPPSLLTLLLSAPWGFSLYALEVEAIAHFWLAAVFSYLFLRRITRSRAAAIVGSLTFTFSGYLTGYPSQQLAVLETVVWLPLILFFIHRAYHPEAGEEQSQDKLTPARPDTTRTALPEPDRQPLPSTPAPRPAFPSLLLAGLTWGLALLAGHPQSALILAYLSIAYLLFLGSEAAKKRRSEEASQRIPKGGFALRESQHAARSTQHAAKGTQATVRSLPLGRITHYALRITHYASRFTLPPLLFLLTGLGLAAVQFFPAVEYTRLSVRATGIYDNMAGGLPLTDLVQLLLPGLVSLYSPLYVGVVAFILAIWVPFTGSVYRRHVTFWAVLAFLSFLISFGGNTFLYSPLYLFAPGFSIFRGQERWAVAVAFSLSALAAYGFKELVPVKPAAFSRLLSLTLYLFILALLLVLLSFYGLNDSGWTPDSPFYSLLGQTTLLTLLLALAWLGWRFSARLHPALTTGLIAALLCFDLFTANWQTNLYPQQPEWHTRLPAAVAAIKQDASSSSEPYRVYNEFRLYDNYGVPFEVEELWGASPLRPARYDEFMAPPMPIERAWELLNVKYVITWRQELYLPSTIIYQEPAGQDTTYVHRLETVGPRAWLVTQAEIADDATILAKIADPNFNRWQIALLEPGAEEASRRISESANPQGKCQRVPKGGFALSESANQRTRRASVSESQREASHSASLSTQHAAKGTQATVRSLPWGRNTQHAAKGTQATRITHYGLRITDYVSRFTSRSPQSFSLQVSTPEPALLMLSEVAYPGWQASLDGQPAPILRADYILRAVPLQPGEHTVTLTFRPFSVIAGAVVSGLTVLAAGAFLARARLKRTRDPHEG